MAGNERFFSMANRSWLKYTMPTISDCSQSLIGMMTMGGMLNRRSVLLQSEHVGDR